MALGPLSKVTPFSSTSTIRPRRIKCLTTSAGAPHRMKSPASGASTQYTPVVTLIFFKFDMPSLLLSRNCFYQKATIIGAAAPLEEPFSALLMMISVICCASVWGLMVLSSLQNSRPSICSTFKSLITQSGTWVLIFEMAIMTLISHLIYDGTPAHCTTRSMCDNKQFELLMVDFKENMPI